MTTVDPGVAPGPSQPAPPGGDQLGKRAARGAVVTLGGQLSQVLLQVTSVVVLARLLTPHDYGLYSMVLVIAGVGEILRDFGLSSAAVQAKTLSDDERDNLFWANTMIGFLLAVVVFAGAPAIAILFHQQALTSIARLLAVTFIINGVATQYRANLNRNMRFGTLAITDLAAQVVSITVAIICAALGARYWALVGSQIAQVLTVLIMVASCGRWLPGLPKRNVSIRPFLRFGTSFVLTQFVNYAGSNLDSLTIGVRFGATSLGIYNRAFQLLMSPLNQFRVPATTVALPVLSRLQDDLPRANLYVRRGQLVLGYTIVAGLAFAAGASRPVVDIFLGGSWKQVAPVLSWLAFAGIFQMLSYVGYWVYISRGLTKHLLRYTLISFGIRAVCILVGSNWGIVGVAAGYAIAPGLAWPLSLWWLSRVTVIPIRDLYLAALRLLAMAACTATVSYLISHSLRSHVDVIQVLAAAFGGLCVYALAAALSRTVRSDLRGVGEILRRVLPGAT